jgi:hypothetical protein
MTTMVTRTGRRCCRHPKGSTQLLRLQAPHQRVLQPAGDRHGQGVGPLGVGGGLSQAQAGKGQRLVPDAADPVLGLPWLAAFDAAPGVQDVMPAKPESAARGRVRWPESDGGGDLDVEVVQGAKLAVERSAV